MTLQSRWQRLRTSTNPGGVLHAIHAAASLVTAMEPDATLSARAYRLVLYHAANEVVTVIDDLRVLLDLGDLTHEKGEIKIVRRA
jgi:hypothetical protein